MFIICAGFEDAIFGKTLKNCPTLTKLYGKTYSEVYMWKDAVHIFGLPPWDLESGQVSGHCDLVKIMGPALRGEGRCRKKGIRVHIL